MEQVEIIQKLALAADQYDAAGKSKIADIIDLAIKKIAADVIPFSGSDGELPPEPPEGFSLPDDTMADLVAFLGRNDLLNPDGLDEIITVLQVMQSEMEPEEAPLPEPPDWPEDLDDPDGLEGRVNVSETDWEGPPII